MKSQLTATALIAAALASGGVYSFDQTQIKTLNDEIVAKTEELKYLKDSKRYIVESYLYSQASSCRTPSIDLTYVTPTEISQAVEDSVRRAGLNPKDITFVNQTLQEIAVKKGEMMKCR